VLTLAIDGQFTLIDKGMAVLERTLEERVTALQDAQFKTIGLTVVVIAFAVWLGALMIRAIKQDMAVLQQREEAEREYGKELEVTVERLKQTHAKLEVHQKRWELLHRLDVLLSRSLRLEEIYPAFARAVKELVPYDRIGVVVPDGTLFRMALSVAEPPLVAHQGELWPRAEGCALHCVLAQKSPKLVRDLQVETTCWDGVYRAQEGVRSIACVPLLAGGEAVGVLCLD
jgi:GAF domain-containing protein